MMHRTPLQLKRFEQIRTGHEGVQRMKQNNPRSP